MQTYYRLPALLLASLAFLFSLPSHADTSVNTNSNIIMDSRSETNNTSNTDNETSTASASFINVDMTLDIEGLEQYAADASKSLNTIAETVQEMASNPDLDEKGQAALQATMENINQLTIITKESIDNLPLAFSQSKSALKQGTQTLLDDLQLTLIIAFSALATVIVIAIVCIYWVVLRPMQNCLVNATGNIASMATSIQITAQALKVSTEKQQEIIAYIQSTETNQPNEP